jgi:hypothetical protein
MIRRWFCQHKHTFRERRDGIPMFICSKCGHAEPQITRHAKLHIVPPAHERYQVKVKS